MKSPIPIEDLTYIASSLDDIIPRISNTRIFITGGTGFFGKCILGTLIFLNERHRMYCSAGVLTRNAERFKKDFPQFHHNSITYIQGDLKTFSFPSGSFEYCIHAANETANLDNTDEYEILDAAFQGTNRVLNFAKEKNVASILYISSGAFYGRQPSEMKMVSEDYFGAPDIRQLKSCYGEGKRISEYLCFYHGQKWKLNIKIARCFAFIGPYLPLNSHFACGNFILNCLKNEPILIKGDGSTIRSYMYAADLVICLLKTLIHGENLTAYNIGSNEEISIEQLAQKVSSHFSPKPEILILQKGQNSLPERYVPDNNKIKAKLALKEFTGIDEAIKRTVLFYKNENISLY